MQGVYIQNSLFSAGKNTHRNVTQYIVRSKNVKTKFKVTKSPPNDVLKFLSGYYNTVQCQCKCKIQV